MSGDPLVDMALSYMDRSDIDFLNSGPGRNLDSDSVSLALQAGTVRRYEQSFGIFDPPLLPPAPWFPPGSYYHPGMVVELARASIPAGFVAACSRIDTALIDATTGSAGSWSDPPLWPVVFDWCLTVNSFSDRNIADRSIVITDNLGGLEPFYRICGGVPFMNLSIWSDNRYQWNNRSNEVLFTIPSDSYLRLWGRARDFVFLPHRLIGRLSWILQAETAVSRWRHNRS